MAKWSKRKYSKILSFIIAIVIILVGVIGYNVLSVRAVTNDLLSGDGTFETTNYGNWTYVNTSNFTGSRDAADFHGGASSAKQASTSGTNINFSGYYKHAFTIPHGTLTSVSLQIWYKKIIPSVNAQTYSASWEVYDAADTTLVNSGVINSTTTVTAGAWTSSAPAITGLTDGTTYTLHLKVTGKSNAGTAQSITTKWDDVALNATYTPDTTAPATNMYSPADTSYPTGNINLQATSTDAHGTSSVDFEYANNTSFTGATTITGASIISGSSLDGTWQTSWNTTGLNGTYYVRAKGTDASGNNAYSSSYFTYYVDNTNPTAAITAPSASSKINGSNYAITGSANDTNIDYYRLEYSSVGAGTWTQIGTDQLIGVTNGTLINWDTTTVTDGDYDIRLTSYDYAAHTNSATVSAITVDNTAPTASLSYYSDAALTQPLPASGGKTYTSPGTVYIKMTPSETLRSNAGDNQITIDAPGTANDITNANFTWTGSAWRYAWNVSGGNDGDTFSITVKDTDLVGNVTTGAPSSGGIVNIDTTAPNLSLSYYYDANMTTLVPTTGGKPSVRTGTMYVKLVANEPLSATAGAHKLTIDAPGTVNDVSNQNFVWDAANNAWKYAWTVSGGNDGNTLNVSVIGKDLVGNTYTGAPTSGNVVAIQTQPTPTNLALSASPTNVINDNSSTSTITAHLTDQYGSVITSAQINFTTTKGTLSAANALTNGSGDGTVTVKSGVTGTATITGTLNGTSLSGTTTVTFAPPDNTVPTLDKAEATSKQLVYLTFSEPIKDPNTAGSTISINGGMTISQIVLTSDPRIVRLVLSSTQGTGNQTTPLTYTVTVNNIKDLANNNLASANQNFDAFTPHGKYAPSTFTSGNSTRMCGQCHLAHKGTGKEMLNNITITKTCFVCHGTTGISVYKVEGEFKSRIASGSTLSFTMHKALDSDNPGYNVLYCTDCHNPHGNRTGAGNAVYPKLLRSKVGGSEYYQGNSFCYSCHGSTNQAFSGDVNYYSNTAGNHNNANAVHYDTSIQGGLLLPASGTQITCLKCHEEHGSKNSSLIDNSLSNTEEEVCYKCHGDTTNNNMESTQPTKLNIYRQFNIPSAPSVPTLATTSTGGSLMGNTTYYFKVTAYSSTTGWESLPSLESSITVPAGTNTNKITVTIPQYTGATNGFDQFKVYMGYRLTAPDTFTVTRTAADGSLTAGTYYVIVTAVGPFGESYPSSRKSIAITANDSLSVTAPNYPNVAGYPTANYFKVFMSTTSGSEILQDTVFNNKTKKFRDNLVTGNESVPSFANENNIETYQSAVTANLGGNTTYNQTSAPITTYPVPKGSSHQIDPTDPSRTGSKIECTSCHGPHTSDNVKYSANQATSAMSDPLNTKKYWVQSGTSDSSKTVGTMADWCLQCHSGTGNITQTNTATTKVPYTMGWPNIDFTNNNSGWFKDTVWPNAKHKLAGYQCTTCHDPHGSREHLVLKFPYDGFDYNGNCLRCHDGLTAPAKNIKAEFQKVARHPTLDPGYGGHEIDENYQYSGSGKPNRHAECEDCHDPHSADNTTATAPNPVGSIKNVTGVGFVSNSAANRPAWTSLAYNSTNYVFKRPLQFEYELCYKCHSSYAFGDQEPTSTSGASETDIAKQFNPNNPSYHPVEAVGKNTTIPAGSFANGWTADKQMYCFNCHGDNNKTIRGPHGSTNKYMLRDPYDSGEYTGTIQNTLCLSCHAAAVYAGSSNSQAGTQYSNAGTNLHNTHRNSYYTSYGGSGSWFCGDCHGLYIHGQKRPNLIAYNADPYPYGKWSALKQWRDPGTYGGSYGETSCVTTKKPGTNQNCYSGHTASGSYNP